MTTRANSPAGPAATRVLMIDDDVELCELLRDYLGPEGFHVDAAHDGPTGLQRALAGEHALVILDVMLPGFGGIEVLRRLRTQTRVPVLMLTARGDDVDRILGLELGADDYLPKPFNPRELAARMRAVLRRGERGAGPPDGATDPAAFVLGDLALYPGSLRAVRGGDPLSLTSAEFGLLEVLAHAAGTTVSRDDLSERVLGRRLAAFDRSIDVHVSNLRKKLGKDELGQERIKAVRGLGYLYVWDGPQPGEASR